jgi:LysM repeat protein
LASLAIRYAVGYQRIAADNRLADPNLILAGQRLRIAAPTARQRVIQPGQTLSGVAVETHTSLHRLLTSNPWITNPDKIAAGAELTVAR